MNILVCGGAGYIGSNMVALLAQNGHVPVVYDNFSKGHRSAIGPARFVRGDLADYELLLQTLKEQDIEAVMHFAAFIEVSESLENPLAFYANNVSNTQVVLRAMETAGVQKFVFSSTAAVFGLPDQTPVSENSPQKPLNPYGETKLTSERMCHWQAQTGRLRYAVLRYFNASGAGQDCTLGEDHRPESHLIPLIIQAAMNRRRDIKIYGTDYNTPDGTCIRDYIHVEDLCHAHLLALRELATKRELVYNLGNGTGYSVRDVIETVRSVSGKGFTVIETERRKGDSAILTADSSKARNDLGWTTRYPDLEEIVTTAWEFHNRYPSGYPD